MHHHCTRSMMRCLAQWSASICDACIQVMQLFACISRTCTPTAFWTWNCCCHIYMSPVVVCYVITVVLQSYAYDGPEPAMSINALCTCRCLNSITQCMPYSRTCDKFDRSAVMLWVRRVHRAAHVMQWSGVCGFGRAGTGAYSVMFGHALSCLVIDACWTCCCGQAAFMNSWCSTSLAYLLHMCCEVMLHMNCGMPFVYWVFTDAIPTSGMYVAYMRQVCGVMVSN